jgi:excisionase family DNA binding protein
MAKKLFDKIVSRKDHPQDWVSPQQVADYMNVPVRSVHRWIQDGNLQAERIGPKLIRINIEAFRAFTPSTEFPKK